MTTEDLFAIQVVGAGPLTIKADGNRYDGFATSAAMALHDYHRLAYILHIETRDELEKAHPDIPGPLLTAVASRESGIGAALTSDGWGDRGNAFGILQVDHRYHTLLGPPDPYSFAHMQQAAGILAKAHDDMMTKFPDWQPAMQWRAAVATYNAGDRNEKTWQNLDMGTTHNDYSSDVWARAQVFAVLWRQELQGLILPTDPKDVAAWIRRT
jgi:hypothetical protein